MTLAGTSTFPTSTGLVVPWTGARPTRQAGSMATDRPSPHRDLIDATVRPGTGRLPTPPDQVRRTSAPRHGRGVPAGLTIRTRWTYRTARLVGTRATPGPGPMATQSPDRPGGRPLVAGGVMDCGRPARPSPGASSPDTSRRRVMTPRGTLAPATSRQATDHPSMTRRSMSRRFTTRRSTTHRSTTHPDTSRRSMSNRLAGRISRLGWGRDDRQ
jgi:hypothetical protein